METNQTYTLDEAVAAMKAHEGREANHEFMFPRRYANGEFQVQDWSGWTSCSDLNSSAHLRIFPRTGWTLGPIPEQFEKEKTMDEHKFEVTTDELHTLVFNKRSAIKQCCLDIANNFHADESIESKIGDLRCLHARMYEIRDEIERRESDGEQ